MSEEQTYDVSLYMEVSQTVSVRASSPEQAVERALEMGMDQPNISNRFEASSDVQANVVYDESGELVLELQNGMLP